MFVGWGHNQDLSGNKLRLVGVAHLLATNCKLDKLHVLNLADCGLTKDAGQLLQRVLTECAALQQLGLGWNHLNGAVDALAAGLGSNDSLVALDLSWLSLGAARTDRGAWADLCTAIGQHTTLTHLDLSRNQLPRAMCTVLAEGIADNHCLLGLHVVGNDCAINPNGFLTVPEPDVADAG